MTPQGNIAQPAEMKISEQENTLYNVMRIIEHSPDLTRFFEKSDVIDIVLMEKIPKSCGLSETKTSNNDFYNITWCGIYLNSEGFKGEGVVEHYSNCSSKESSNFKTKLHDDGKRYFLSFGEHVYGRIYIAKLFSRLTENMVRIRVQEGLQEINGRLAKKIEAIKKVSKNEQLALEEKIRTGTGIIEHYTRGL